MWRLSSVKSILSAEGNEHATAVNFAVKPTFGVLHDPEQSLHLPRPDRSQQDARSAQLFEQRRRDFGCRAGDEDAVERGLLGEPEAAVAGDHDDFAFWDPRCAQV